MAIDILYGDGQTSIDEEEREDLIPFWITNNRQLNRLEQENINAAMSTFYKKKLPIKKILTISLVKNLHKKVFDRVWKWAGEFRKTDKNIGVTKNEIITSTYILFGDVNFWISKKIFSKDEIVIRCKHRLVSIHPFVNGGGRDSRVFADMLIRSLGSDTFSWGSSISKARQSYLSALRKSDKNDYTDLIKFARR